jgi:hypothetical protein
MYGQHPLCVLASWKPVSGNGGVAGSPMDQGPIAAVLPTCVRFRSSSHRQSEYCGRPVHGRVVGEMKRARERGDEGRVFA